PLKKKQVVGDQQHADDARRGGTAQPLEKAESEQQSADTQKDHDERDMQSGIADAEREQDHGRKPRQLCLVRVEIRVSRLVQRIRFVSQTAARRDGKAQKVLGMDIETEGLVVVDD